MLSVSSRFAFAAIAALVAAGPAAAQDTPPAAQNTPPAADAYAFRLVARRSLYDQGTLVQHCEDLAGLAPGPEVRLHPSDLSTLGVEAPANVLLKAGDRTASVPTVADPEVAKGTAVVLLHQGDRAVDALLRSGDVAADVRIEVVR